jgi:hypothetical protein
MTEKKPLDDEIEGTDAATENPARREALIKIGKYAAYTAPAMIVTIGTAQAGGMGPGPAPTSTPAP